MKNCKPVVCLVGFVLAAVVAATASGGAPPALTSISPMSLSPGMLVTLNGSSLGGPVAVQFGSVQQKTFLSVTGSQIVVVVPPGVVAASVSVTTGAGTSNAIPYTVIPLGVISLQMSIDGIYATPIKNSFSSSRIWGASSTPNPSWADLNPSLGTYSFSQILDTPLANLKANGISDGVEYTFGAVPNWASSNGGDAGCQFGNGTCDLPFDVDNVKGSGLGDGKDTDFKTFVAAIASYVNNHNYLTNHAHIKYWEVWNEWYSNSKINPRFGCGGSGCQINATYAQMVRLAEDVRCTITGAGTVEGVPCTATAIDPSAVILTPSTRPFDDPGTPPDQSLEIMENFLHCDKSPIGPCNTISDPDRGSKAVDVIAWHTYPGPEIPPVPEDFYTWASNITQLLSATDQKRPMFSTEGSWGENNTENMNQDSPEAVGFVARYMLNCFSTGFALCNWYEYDNQFWGTLCDGQTNCSLNVSGAAFQQVSSWLVNNATSAPYALTPCSKLGTGSIYTCSIVRPGVGGGQPTQTMAVWDENGCLPSCSNFSGTLAPWANQYYTLANGNPTQIIKPVKGTFAVAISYQPILLSQ
jgi:hypothetical protein